MLRVTAHRSRHPRALLATFLVATAILVPLPVHAQSQASSDSATLQGTIRDSNGKPVAGAAVYLETKDNDASLIPIAHTEADGTYRCSPVREGLYTLRSKAAGFIDAAFGPFAIDKAETKKIDLTLAPETSRSTGLAEAPQFYDEPQFTVAGVTDTTSLGGHGSTATARNTESLTRDITSLTKETPSPKSASGAVNPTDYADSLVLARAYADSGNYNHARSTLLDVLAKHDQADAHHLLADVEEKLNHPLEAVHHYQRAAEIDPSEPNLFDWGAELLVHHASEPAAEVFTKGNHLFPKSARMLIGLGVAWNARGASDKAAQYLCDASDLNPNDPDPYLFLGRLQQTWTAPSEASARRLARFARLQPENALADYYYAVSVWKRRKGTDDSASFTETESLLQKAIRLDPKLGLAHLQLGILYSERKDFPKAIAVYQKAIDVSPDLEESHYRIAQAYRQVGETAKAQQETQLYTQLLKKSAEDLERERREMPQFVYTLRGRPADAPPQ